MSAVSKRERTRLAKAELLMFLATTTETWKKMLTDAEPHCLPVAEWLANDPFRVLCRTYQLAPADLARLCDRIGDELEGRAVRAGYENYWDWDEAAAPWDGAR